MREDDDNWAIQILDLNPAINAYNRVKKGVNNIKNRIVQNTKRFLSKNKEVNNNK